MTTRPAILSAALLAAALLAVGCTSAPEPHGWDEPEHGLLYRSAGPARSLTMDSAAQRMASAEAPNGAFDPWYLGRNDALASVVYGERSSVSETSVTFSRDSQSIFRGRVSDRYNQTTFRRRVQSISR